MHKSSSLKLELGNCALVSDWWIYSSPFTFTPSPANKDRKKEFPVKCGKTEAATTPPGQRNCQRILKRGRHLSAVKSAMFGPLGGPGRDGVEPRGPLSRCLARPSRDLHNRNNIRSALFVCFNNWFRYCIFYYSRSGRAFLYADSTVQIPHSAYSRISPGGGVAAGVDWGCFKSSLYLHVWLNFQNFTTLDSHKYVSFTQKQNPMLPIVQKMSPSY